MVACCEVQVESVSEGRGICVDRPSAAPVSRRTENRVGFVLYKTDTVVGNRVAYRVEPAVSVSLIEHMNPAADDLAAGSADSVLLALLCDRKSADKLPVFHIVRYGDTDGYRKSRRLFLRCHGSREIEVISPAERNDSRIFCVVKPASCVCEQHYSASVIQMISEPIPATFTLIPSVISDPPVFTQSAPVLSSKLSL